MFLLIDGCIGQYGQAPILSGTFQLLLFREVSPIHSKKGQKVIWVGPSARIRTSYSGRIGHKGSFFGMDNATRSNRSYATQER